VGRWIPNEILEAVPGGSEVNKDFEVSAETIVAYVEMENRRRTCNEVKEGSGSLILCYFNLTEKAILVPDGLGDTCWIRVVNMLHQVGDKRRNRRINSPRFRIQTSANPAGGHAFWTPPVRDGILGWIVSQDNCIF
jgi:hypothetical protein